VSLVVREVRMVGDRWLRRYDMGRDCCWNRGGEGDIGADISTITLAFLCQPFFRCYRLIRRRRTMAFFIVTWRRLIVDYQLSERAYCSVITFIPKTDSTSSSKTFVTTCQTTGCHKAEHYNRYIHCLGYRLTRRVVC
jgi:hypothetical protein